MAERNDYALDTFPDIVKQDPMRLLDLGNDIQVATSYLGAPTELERATSNFDKLVEGKRRPISHTLTDATRIVPDILTVLLTLASGGSGVAVKAGKEVPAATGKVVKGIWRKALEQVAKKAPKKFADRQAAKGLGSKLAIKAAEKVSADNFKVSKAMSDIVVHSKGKTPRELQHFILDNLDKLARQYKVEKSLLRKAAMNPETYIGHPEVYRLATNIGKRSWDEVTEEMMQMLSGSTDPATMFAARLAEKGAINEAARNVVEKGMEGMGIDSAKTLKSMQKAAEKASKTTPSMLEAAATNGLKTEAKLGIGRAVATGIKGAQGQEAEGSTEQYSKNFDTHPVKDVLKSLIGVDYTDPARFVQDDIEAYWKFLQDNSFIDRQQKDVSPRVKVQVITGINKDPEWSKKVKEAWNDQKVFYFE